MLDTSRGVSDVTGPPLLLLPLCAVGGLLVLSSHLFASHLPQKSRVVGRMTPHGIEPWTIGVLVAGPWAFGMLVADPWTLGMLDV